MKRLIISLLTLISVTCMMAGTPVRKQLFDDGWQFALNDSTKWRPVNLPHDWSIEGDFDKDAPAGHDGAYLPTGKGWYRKVFQVSNAKFQDRKLRLYFEGVYMNSEVFVNNNKTVRQRVNYSFK